MKYYSSNCSRVCVIFFVIILNYIRSACHFDGSNLHLKITCLVEMLCYYWMCAVNFLLICLVVYTNNQLLASVVHIHDVLGNSQKSGIIICWRCSAISGQEKRARAGRPSLVAVGYPLLFSPRLNTLPPLHLHLIWEIRTDRITVSKQKHIHELIISPIRG